MLTLPVGALGKARIHSMYPGTQPLGSQYIGCLPYQNMIRLRRPKVKEERRIYAYDWKCVWACCKDCAVIPRLARCILEDLGQHTYLLVFILFLVMLSPDLRPPGKLILGADGLHLPLQLYDITPYLSLPVCLLPQRASW